MFLIKFPLEEPLTSGVLGYFTNLRQVKSHLSLIAHILMLKNLLLTIFGY